MKRSKFSEEQVAYALRQADAGTAVADICRQVGISEATFYVWKERFAHLGVDDVRRVRRLEDENARLKRLVAEPTLDKHTLAAPLRRKSRSPHRGASWRGGFAVTFQIDVRQACAELIGFTSGRPASAGVCAVNVRRTAHRESR